MRFLCWTSMRVEVDKASFTCGQKDQSQLLDWGNIQTVLGGNLRCAAKEN